MPPITRGLFIMALGIAFMSAMDAFIKHLTDEISAPQVLFFRALFGLIPVLLIAKLSGGFKGIKTKRPVLHMLRACLGVIAFISFTVGLRDMSLANALAICFSAPFFMVAFSALLIGEPIGMHRIGAMLLGFGGVVIVLQPDAGIFDTGAPYMVLVAAAYALSQILARKYAASESAVSFSFWTTSGMTLFGLILLPFFWVPMSMDALIWCLLMGIFGGIGHYFMTEAVRIAPPTVVSPMEYTALIWAAAFDWIFWQLIPAYATLAGSLVIIASGIYILWRERLHNNKGVIHVDPSNS